MLLDLLRALGLVAAIFAGGAGLTTLLVGRQGWWPLVYAWPLGLIALQLCGLSLAPHELLWHRWQWITLFALLGLALCTRLERPVLSLPGAVWTAALALLALKAALLLFTMLHWPDIDSDAANWTRWIGYAKRIRGVGGLAPGEVIDRRGPSLLAGFIALFLSRWRDSLVVLPWWASWVALIALACALARRAPTLLAAPLVFAFASMPLAITHVIRPGFADLLVALFLLAALLALQEAQGAKGVLLAALCALGCALVKKEGAVWSAWLALAAVTLALERRKRASAGKLALGWLGLGVLLVLVHQLLAPLFASSLQLDYRVRWLVEARWDPRAPALFLAAAFSASSFGLLWWLALAASISLAVRAPEERLLVLLLWAPVLALAYFCCFTGNVEQTLSGFNAGRFLLQLSPLALALTLRWAARTGADTRA